MGITRRFRSTLPVVAALLIGAMTTASPPVAAQDTTTVGECDAVAWSGTVDGTSQVWTAAADGADRVEISSAGDGSDPVDNFVPQWSPDGTKIVWQGRDGVTSQVWVAAADGSNRVEISSAGTGPDPVANAVPQWSPDGTKIVWQGSDGATSQVWVAAADGADRVEISSAGPGSDPVENFDPHWSPTGSQIAWSGEIGGVRQVFVADTDGADRTAVSSQGTGEDPTENQFARWSPDGTRLSWSGWDGTTHRVFVADADGANRIEVSSVGEGPDPVANFGAEWSPNGARLTWEGSDGGATQVWVADADGANRVELSSVGEGPDPIENIGSQWSPDGNRIAWSGRVEGVRQVFVADVDEMNRTEISSAGSGAVDNFSPQWAPRSGGVSLSATSTQTVLGETATFTVTVTTLCPHGSVVIGGITPPACLAPASVQVSTGTVTGSTWTIDELAGSATATISGTVAEVGDCTGVAAVVSSSPAVEATTAAAASFGAESTACPTSPAHGFIDVASTSFANDDITCIKAMGITTGTSPTTYSPLDDVTREQMAAFLARTWRAVGNECPVGAEHGFVDVDRESFAYDDIACIKALELTTGTGPSIYSPDDDVTREQMAAFLARTWRARGHECPADLDHGFVDVPDWSFAANDIACIRGLGITTGTSETTYSPGNNVTREQMAAFLARLIRADAIADTHGNAT